MTRSEIRTPLKFRSDCEWTLRRDAIDGRVRCEETRNETILSSPIGIIARAYRNYHLSRAAYLAPTGKERLVITRLPLVCFVCCRELECMEDVSGPGLLVLCQMACLQPRSIMRNLRASLPQVGRNTVLRNTWLGRITLLNTPNLAWLERRPSLFIQTPVLCH